MNKRIFSVFVTMVIVYGMLFMQPLMGNAIANPELSSPIEESMLEEPLEAIDTVVQEGIDDNVMPGATVLVSRHGNIVKQDAYGYAAKYEDDDFTEMDDPVEMQENTIFDMASISKLFTAVAVMQLWDKGYFELDDPMADYLPEYDTSEKRDITIKQLLTHTSGEKPGPTGNLYEMDGDREELLAYVMDEPLENDPGEAYVYSDINYITLGVFVERLSGEREDDYVEKHILNPLGMSDTMYNPSDDLRSRIAATEYQPWTDRGLVWGSVHDEKAWALDGVAGHAGVFSSALDMNTFSQMLMNKGSYQDDQIVSEEAFDLMNTNWNEAFPDQEHGLGWDLNQDWYMDVLAEEDTLGHTGFTGTSMVVSLEMDTVVILLTNNVHPTRDNPTTNPIRKQTAAKTASAIYAWDAGMMQQMVDRFKDLDDISDDDTARLLDTHLAAVKQFEETNQTEKVLKHLEGFQDLLEFQYDEDLISDTAYETLNQDAAYLMNDWK